MVVQVVSEQLDVRDRRRGGLRGEVAGEQDWWKGGEKKREERTTLVWRYGALTRYEVMSVLTKGDVSDVLGSLESGQMSDLERRFPVRVHHLWRVLDPRQSSSIHELLQNRTAAADKM